VFSLVIPVFNNEASLPEVVRVLADMHERLGRRLEAIFVVDGSPDDSYAFLRRELEHAPFASQLLLLSRNFGSFAAIREGLRAAQGPYFAVMAADLQEPPDLVLAFFRTLEGEPVDLALGTREGR
jgi:polyisoprenyl-phosphate glycosyltransferase